jgi:hypothetical protein
MIAKEIIGVYDKHFMVVIGEPYEKLKNIIDISAIESNFKESQALAFGARLITNPKYYYFVVWFNENYINAGIIAHECIHVASMIFNNIHAEYDFNNPEPFTFLVEHLVNIVTEKCKRYGISL